MAFALTQEHGTSVSPDRGASIHLNNEEYRGLTFPLLRATMRLLP